MNTATVDNRMPPGIPFIIGNEFAERFSYYGMRGILVARSGLSKGARPGVPVIQSLREVRGLL